MVLPLRLESRMMHPKTTSASIRRWQTLSCLQWAHKPYLLEVTLHLKLQTNPKRTGLSQKWAAAFEHLSNSQNSNNPTWFLYRVRIPVHGHFFYPLKQTITIYPSIWLAVTSADNLLTDSALSWHLTVVFILRGEESPSLAVCWWKKGEYQ